MTEYEKEWFARTAYHELVKLEAIAIVDWLEWLEQNKALDKLSWHEVRTCAEKRIEKLDCQHVGFCAYTHFFKKNMLDVLSRAGALCEEYSYVNVLDELNMLFGRKPYCEDSTGVSVTSERKILDILFKAKSE